MPYIIVATVKQSIWDGGTGPLYLWKTSYGRGGVPEMSPLR